MFDRITTEAEKMGGVACIRGLYNKKDAMSQGFIYWRFAKTSESK